MFLYIWVGNKKVIFVLNYCSLNGAENSVQGFVKKENVQNCENIIKVRKFNFPGN